MLNDKNYEKKRVFMSILVNYNIPDLREQNAKN